MVRLHKPKRLVEVNITNIYGNVMDDLTKSQTKMKIQILLAIKLKIDDGIVVENDP
ncbi:22882_t:CDS:2, partial [Entrophospora sp. SA101]